MSKVSSAKKVVLVAGVQGLNHAYQSTVLSSGMLVDWRCAQIGTWRDFPMGNGELHVQRQMSNLHC